MGPKRAKNRGRRRWAGRATVGGGMVNAATGVVVMLLVGQPPPPPPVPAAAAPVVALSAWPWGATTTSTGAVWLDVDWKELSLATRVIITCV